MVPEITNEPCTWSGAVANSVALPKIQTLPVDKGAQQTHNGSMRRKGTGCVVKKGRRYVAQLPRVKGVDLGRLPEDFDTAFAAERALDAWVSQNVVSEWWQQVGGAVHMNILLPFRLREEIERASGGNVAHWIREACKNRLEGQ